MTDKTGGPAFPNTTWDNELDQVIDQGNGMSLRDYFAAKAMQAIASDPNVDMTFGDMALWAYEMAGAMLKARGE